MADKIVKLSYDTFHNLLSRNRGTRNETIILTFKLSNKIGTSKYLAVRIQVRYS